MINIKAPIYKHGTRLVFSDKKYIGEIERWGGYYRFRAKADGWQDTHKPSMESLRESLNVQELKNDR